MNRKLGVENSIKISTPGFKRLPRKISNEFSNELSISNREESCDECETNAATYTCKQCEQKLCLSCKEHLHRKGARARHSIEMISEYSVENDISLEKRLNIIEEKGVLISKEGDSKRPRSTSVNKINETKTIDTAPNIPSPPSFPSARSNNSAQSRNSYSEHSDQSYASKVSPGNMDSVQDIVNEEKKFRKWDIKDFHVQGALGKGRFGNVYFAREKLSRVQVALKVQFKSSLLSSGPQILLNFRREVEIQSRLHHPHILKMFGYFQDSKNIYFIMEAAQGRDVSIIVGGELFKMLKRGGGSFPPHVTSKYVRQLSESLAYIHGRNIIHRDLKPENVLTDSEGNAKLADFGWAVHALPPTQDQRSTLCGTPEYLSPEMVRAKMKYNDKVDIWALGVFCYELLTGSPPFTRMPVNAIATNDEVCNSEVELKEGIAEDNLNVDMFQRIAIFDGNLSFPVSVTCPNAKDFCRKLMKPNPLDRPRAEELAEIDWLWN